MYSQVEKKKDEKYAFLSALPCSFANIQCKQPGGSGDVTVTDTSCNKLQPSPI